MLTFSIISMAFAILAALKTEQVVGEPYPEFSNKISPALLSALENDDTPDVLVMFSGGNSELLQRSSLLDIDDRGERNAAIRDQLMEHSDQSQGGVVDLLSTLRSSDDHLEFRKFWISNQMWVKGGDMKTIRAITEDPQVAYVDIEPVRTLFDGERKREAGNRGANDRPEDGTIQWNIQRIRAPEAWEELGDTKGEGVLVGVIDTGVLHTHETLRDNFLGNYGWFDGTFRGKLEPYDDTWHGTMVTSLAVGSRGIGVAPGATWSHCKACDHGGCKTKDILVCGEFFACPTLANGSDPDCSKSPHVIVNSWGYGEENLCEPEAGMVVVWESMGIIPVFAVGNYGYCESIACPGIFPNVIGVGSINIDNSSESTGSSKGPTEDGRIKPDITAYGVDVLGATPHAEDHYDFDSGTSFSCPQVAGVVALLLSRDLTMSFAQVTQLLYNNTDQESLEVPGKNSPPFVWLCDSVINGTLIHPNNHYGFGLVNALEAVKAQTNEISQK